uniref:Uncharacterized protein n=1 Tax=Glossina austeni TaxID=7395 RepID=A0A1A9V0L7_GLOAU
MNERKRVKQPTFSAASDNTGPGPLDERGHAFETKEEDNGMTNPPTMAPLVASTIATRTLQVLTVTPTMPCSNEPNGKTRNSCINSMELQSISDMTEKAESSSVATKKHLKKSKSENSLKTLDYDKRNANSDYYGHQRGDRSRKEEIERFQARLQSDGKYICNYGSVVIYSELPCSELTNIRVSGTNRHPPSDEVALKPQSIETGQNYVNEDKIVGNENLENSQEKRKRRPNGSNKRRKSNKRQNGELHKQQYSRQQKRKVNQSRGNKNSKRSSKTRQYKKEYAINTHKDAKKEANAYKANNENQ